MNLMVVEETSNNQALYDIIWLHMITTRFFSKKDGSFVSRNSPQNRTKLFMLRSKGITGIPWGTSRRRARGAGRTSSNGWGTGAWWSIFLESAESAAISRSKKLRVFFFRWANGASDQPACLFLVYLGDCTDFKGIITSHDTYPYELNGFWTVLTWFSRWGTLGDMPGTWRKIVHEMVMWISLRTWIRRLIFLGQINAVFFFRFLTPLPSPRCLKKTRKKTNLTWNVRRMQ